MRALHGSFAALAFIFVSCGDDLMESVSVSGDATESSSTSAATTVSTTDDGGSTSASSEGAAATTDGGKTTTGTSDGGESSSSAVESTSEPASTTESTGEPVDCVSLEAAECREARGCMALEGSEYVHVTGTEYCLDDKTFAACVAETACDQADTWGCDGNDTWLFPTTCLPDGWIACDEPEPDPMPCE